MSVRTAEDRIWIEGAARVEDAEALFNAIETHADRPIDLSGCADMHAAVLQILLVFSPRIEGAGENPDLSHWICRLLDRPGQREAPSEAGQDQ